MNKKYIGKLVKYRPKRIGKGQEWFWTEAWQKGEREADENIRKGKVKEFTSWESAMAYLDGLKQKKRNSVKAVKN